MDDEGLVLVRLEGGLGNNLFQLAAGRSLAAARKARLVVFGGQGGETVLDALLGDALTWAEPSYLAALGVDLHVPESAAQRTARRARGTLRRARRQVHRHRQPTTTSHAPQPAGLATRSEPVLLLEGWFQHPSWWGDGLATVTAPLRDALTGPLAPTDPGGTVVALRRGDYLRLGWALPLAYYEHALRALDRRDGPCHVVSDDPLAAAFARDWLAARGFAPADDRPAPHSRRVRDLARLATADQVVMANSTFCWWGVQCGPAARPVVAPRTWVPIDGSAVLLQPGWRLVDPA